MTPWQEFQQRKKEKESKAIGSERKSAGTTPWQQQKERRKALGLPETPKANPVSYPGRASARAPQRSPEAVGFSGSKATPVVGNESKTQWEIYREALDREQERYLANAEGYTAATEDLLSYDRNALRTDLQGAKGPKLSQQKVSPGQMKAQEQYAQEATKYKASVDRLSEEWQTRLRKPEEIRAELDSLEDDSHIVGPTRRMQLENELWTALNTAYEGSYKEGNFDLLGLSKAVGEDSKRMKELEQAIQEDQYVLDNWPGQQPGHTPTRDMLDSQRVVWKRIERNRMELSQLRKEATPRNEEYNYYLSRIFADEKNDPEAEKLIAQGKEKYEASWEGYESYLKNMEGYKATLAMTGEGDLSRALAPYRKEARSHYPLAVMTESLSEEDQRTFYYLIGRGLDNLALQFADESSYEDRMEQQAKIRQWAGSNLGTGILATAGSLLTLPVAWSDPLLAEGSMSATGLSSSGVGFGGIRDNLRTGVSDAMNQWGTLPENVPVLGGKGFGDLYQLGMSMADSYLSGAAMGPGASYVLGGSAFASAYNQAIDKGASRETALLQGVAQGVSETLFEYLSLDKLFNGDVSGSFIKSLLQQGGIEASEEMCTSLANHFTDRMIMGERSEYELSKKAYTQEGKSPEEAARLAKWDFIESLVADAFGGFLSGGGMSAANTAISRIVTAEENKFNRARELLGKVDESTDAYSIGRALHTVGVEFSEGEAAAMVEELEARGKSHEEAQSAVSILNKAVKGERLTSQQRKLLQGDKETAEILRAMVGQETASIPSEAQETTAPEAVEYTGKPAGQTGMGITRAAARTYQETVGLSLPEAERAAAVLNGIVTEGWKTVSNNDIDSLKLHTSKGAEAASKILGVEISQARSKAEARDTFRSVLAEYREAHPTAQLDSTENAQAANLTGVDRNNSDSVDDSTVAGVKTVLESQWQPTEDGKTHLADSGEAVSIRGVDRVEQGKGKNTVYLSVVDASGNESVVPGEVVDYGSREEMILYEGFGQLGISADYFPEYMRGFLHHREMVEGLTAGEYVQRFEGAVNYGRHDMKGALSRSGLLADAQRTAYEAGQQSREDQRNQQKQQTREAVQERKDSGKGKVHKKGELHYPSNMPVKLSKIQKAGVKLAQRLASFGLDVYLYRSSLNKQGQWVDDRGEASPNGYYVTEDGSIHVDLNAGSFGRGTVVFTLSHEITHFLARHNLEGFDTFARLLVEWYEGKGVHVEDLAQAEMDEHGYSWEVAFEEVVARSCESFLTDSDILIRLTELRNKHSKLYEQIRSSVLKFVNWMRKLFQDIEPESFEGRMLHEARGTIDHLYEVFTSALDSAIDTYQWAGVQKNTTDEGGVMYSRGGRKDKVAEHMKEITEADISVLQAMGARTSISQLSHEQLNAVKKWAYRFYKRMRNRSPFFRAWFGDWRSADTNGVKWVEISKKEYSTRRREVKSVELGGNVIVETDLFNDSLHYAIKNGDKTAIEKLLSHIDELIKNGVLLDTWISGRTSGNKKGTTQFMHYLYCPVEYNGAPFLAKITVEEYDVNGKQRAYNAQRIKMLALPRAHFAQLNKQAKTRNMRLQANEIMVAQLFDLVKQFDGNFKSCNNDSAQASKIVNPDGTPMVVYHQTQNDFSVFDTHHTGAGTSDYITPFGIFLKPGSDDIGINGNIQMPLYASIKRPLTVANRSELLTYLRKDKRYNALYEEIKNRTPIYEAKLEAAQKAVQDYIARWEKENPTANSRDLYHIDEFNELSDKEDELVDEWERLNDETAERAKNRIVEYLKRQGYDGVIIEHDQGSYGRGTKAIIAFDSTQVKSATDNVGTFSKINPDIYFSQRGRDSLQSTLQAMDPAVVENPGERRLLQRYQTDAQNRMRETRKQQDLEAELRELETSQKPDRQRMAEVKEALVKSYNRTEALDQRMISAEVRLGSLAEGKGRLGTTSETELLSMSMEELRERVAQVEEQLKASYARQDTLTEQRDHAKEQSHRTKGVRVDRTGVYDFVKGLLEKNHSKSRSGSEVKAKTDELLGIFNKAAEIYDRLGYNATDTYLLLSIEDYARGIAEDGSAEAVVADLMQEFKRVLESPRLQTAVDKVVQHYEGIIQQQKQRLAQQRAKAQEREEAIVSKYQEARSKSVDSRRKTVMKGKIKRTLGELNSLLKHGNKKKNVKIGMQDTAASLLAYGELLFSEGSQISPEAMVRSGVQTDLTEKESQLLNEYMDLLQKKDEYLKKISNVEKYKHGDWVSRVGDLQHMVDYIDRNKLSKLNKELEAVFERERSRINKISFSAVLQDLVNSYKALENAQEAHIRGAYNSFVYDRLVAMNDKDAIGGTTVKDMNLAQLTELYDAVKMVVTSIKNANKLFRSGKAETLAEMVDRVQSEIRKLYRKRGDPNSVWGKITDTLKSFTWNELKPYYAFERLGSDALMELYWDVIKAESDYGAEILSAGEYIEEVRKKYGYKDWDMDTVRTFEAANGMDFKLTLGDIMSIYAYSRRDQAYKHMTTGGFTFNTGKTEKYKDENGVSRARLTETETYRMTDEIIHEIIGTLTPEQRAYAETMQDYLTKLGEKGNEVSRAMYGVDLFKEKFYFPLRSDKDYRSSAEQQLNATQTTASLVNVGMAKETVPQASNPIVLQRFDDVAINHIDQMLKYHAYVLPIENLRKVMDFTQISENDWDTTVKKLISAVFGNSASQYLEQWITDLNGGSTIGGAQNPLSQFFATSKKVSVAGNLSVVVQQYFAVARAAVELDAKYFVPFKGSEASSSDARQWDELKKYAPIAVIKEMGGFDMGSSRTALGYIGTAETKVGFTDKVDNVMSWGASKMDEIGWSSIWRAVKKEVADKQGLQPGTEKFFEAAGKRFTEIIVKTQVYDSVTSRSGFMRSKHDSVKYLVSFMGEPTTVVNMMYSAQLKLVRAYRSGNTVEKQKAVRKMARTSMVLILSSVLTSLAKSLPYAMRDDEETEAFWERYWKQFGTALRSDMNPLGMLPVTRDILSMIDGWDIERPDVALLKDVITGFTRAIKGDKPVEDWLSFGLSVFNLLGVPMKNIYRDGRGFVRLFGDMTDDIRATDKGGAFVRGFKGETRSKSETLYAAIVGGESGRVAKLRSGYKDLGAYTSAVRKALRECDPRIHEAALARYEGDITSYMNIAKEIKAEGHFVQDDIVAAIVSEEDAIKKNTEGEKSSNPSSPAMYDGEDYMAAVLDEPETAEAVKSYIIERYIGKGKSQEDAQAAFYGEVRGTIRENYDLGTVDYDTTYDYLIQFGGYSDDEAYWALDKWNYALENGSSDGYSKYNEFLEAVETGEDLAETVQFYLSRGVTKDSMEDNIRNHFRPIYIELDTKSRADLKVSLLDAYEALGYDRIDRSKAIDRWLQSKD